MPVGVDQVQHLQLARELAKKFNHVYGETFPLPIPLINGKLILTRGNRNFLYI